MKALTDSQRKPLWEHQVDAIDFAVRHLQSVDGPCLIRMPTGTGKTGVIACLTRIANSGNTSLVLTPWAHLRDQMVGDVKENFWKKIRITPEPMLVEPITPTSTKATISKAKPTVLVATFATLNQLRVDDEDVYRQLTKAISLVVVDEGHYEPAVEWGKSVKGLRQRTVLLTATPYRNDLKLFRIKDSTRSTFHFTHKDATRRKVIRELDFRELPAAPDLASRTDAFAQDWIGLKRDGSLPSARARAIVCCAGADDIREVVTRLRDQGIEAIGIHDQFKRSTSKYLMEDVPDPKTESSEIWVHQHKLTEGLDDSRFCCVGLLTRIKNDRKLIQQVGRILRRGDGDRSKPAVLVCPAEWSVKAEWTAYRKFETELRLLEPQHFRDVVDKLLTEQPDVEYFEGKFRSRFDPGILNSNPQVLLSPSVLARKRDKDFKLDEYIEDCTDTLNTQDAVILGPDINGPCQRTSQFALWVYASVGNSRSLGSASLYEIRLETHCAVVAEGLLLVSDSRGNYPIQYLEKNTSALSPSQLAKFLDRSFRPTHVSVDSSIPYEAVVRGADLHGHNLLKIPTSLTDRVQICRSARGHSKKLGRRYVGMSNGRLRSEVSDEIRRQYDLEEFVAWANRTAQILESNAKSNQLFDRFMPTCAPPVNLVPKTISIDLLRFDSSLTLDDEEDWELKRSSSDIIRSGSAGANTYKVKFEFEGPKGKEVSVILRLEYQSNRQRFWFTKEEGPAIRVEIAEEAATSKKSFADFLNQKQDVLLIGLEGGSIVYQGKNFYEVDYTYAEKALFSLIERPRRASACATEKGTEAQIKATAKSKSTDFPLSSVFRELAEESLDAPFLCDVLICDDMGTECADFLAASFDKKQLALIHAKVGSGTQVSAAAFHEVASQAMKNLTYLTRNAEVPEGAPSWRKDRYWKKTQIPRLLKSPPGRQTATSLWNELKSDIIYSSNAELYVVLATAGCCDIGTLARIVVDPSQRTPETAQLVHLLDGLNSYAKQLGVKLLIYDLPFVPKKKGKKKSK